MESRLATTQAALRRLDIKGAQLILHVMGADRLECSNWDAVFGLIAPLCAEGGTLRARFFGPNIPSSMHEERQRLQLTASCSPQLYHDYLANADCEEPSLVMAFNAGIWGYEEWGPTLLAMQAAQHKSLLVVTSYTLEESEDDSEVLQKYGQPLWLPEENPHRSQIRRPTVDDKGRAYHDNFAWQAWVV